MFFEENEICDLIKCDKCKLKLDEPRILPCGFTICFNCVESIQMKGEIFDCTLCKEEHHINPSKGLPINKTVLKMLSIKPVEFSRGKQVNLLKLSLIEIQNIVNSIQFGLENSVDKVKEHCLNLKSDVQLATEETIEQINQLNELFINKIDDYQEKCIHSFENNTISNKMYLQEFTDIINELESFKIEGLKYLKQIQIDDDVIIQKNEKALDYIRQAEEKKIKLENLIFNDQLVKFEANKTKLSNITLGYLTVRNIDSFVLSYILTNRQVTELIKLCEFSADQKWKLIYRATQNGFEASKFHNKCDNKLNTFVIIKSTNGNVFGGYTEQSWVGEGWKKDLNAFIFSLINKYSKPIKMKCVKDAVAIGCNTGHGPIFGDGFDLAVDNNSNLKSNNNKTQSNLGKSYVHPEFEFKSSEARTFLAGSYTFQTSEIEVYIKD